jgi:hypothetical protein
MRDSAQGHVLQLIEAFLSRLAAYEPTFNVAVHLPLAASHTPTVLSLLPLARDRPSGLHATLVTSFECPCIGIITADIRTTWER